MNRPSDQEIIDLLDWICPRRHPKFSWMKPKHTLVDKIQYELLIAFTDDDLDMGAFRQIVNNYMAHSVACSERPPLGRVIFTLQNVWTTAYISTIHGRLECVEHDHVKGIAPAVSVSTSMEPYTEDGRATFGAKEYYVDGRRHRSTSVGVHLPAVERQITHTDPKRPNAHIETNTEVQYWMEGQPIYGPRPWQICSDMTAYVDDHGKLICDVINLEVKWMVDWQPGAVPEHPVRLTAEKVRSISLPNRPTDHLLPEWMPDHADSPNIITERTFEGFKLYWPVAPGRVAVVTGEELFERMAVSTLNIDWAGAKFFLDENDSFAFTCHLMSEDITWQS